MKQEEATKKNTVSRNTNIELLRIFAMILIIAHHFAVHGGFVFDEKQVTINRLWVQFLNMGGKIGVNLFVLISGYFLIDSEKIKASKLAKLWGQIVFYSIAFWGAGILLGEYSLSVSRMIGVFFPIIKGYWWFASTFFVLYLCSPYLNVLLKGLSRWQYITMLCVFTFLWSFIPTVIGFFPQGNNLLWFFLVYSFAAFIRLYHVADRFACKRAAIASLVLYLATFLSAVIFDILGTRSDVFLKHTTHFFGQYQLPVLLISICIFVSFHNLKMENSRIVNTMAATMFGVYLIHDSNEMRSFLWNDLFKNASFSDSKLLIPYSVLVITVVLVGSAFFEYLRIKLIEPVTIKLIAKPIVFLEERMKGIVAFLDRKIEKGKNRQGE